MEIRIVSVFLNVSPKNNSQNGSLKLNDKLPCFFVRFVVNGIIMIGNAK